MPSNSASRESDERHFAEAREQLLDAAVERNGVVVGREAPRRVFAHVAPLASAGADVDLGYITGGHRREQAELPGCLACLELTAAQCACAQDQQDKQSCQGREQAVHRTLARR